MNGKIRSYIFCFFNNIIILCFCLAFFYLTLYYNISLWINFILIIPLCGLSIPGNEIIRCPKCGTVEKISGFQTTGTFFPEDEKVQEKVLDKPEEKK